MREGEREKREGDDSNETASICKTTDIEKIEREGEQEKKK